MQLSLLSAVFVAFCLTSAAPAPPTQAGYGWCTLIYCTDTGGRGDCGKTLLAVPKGQKQGGCTLGWTLGYLCSLKEQLFFFLYFYAGGGLRLTYVPNGYSQRRGEIQR